MQLIRPTRLGWVSIGGAIFLLLLAVAIGAAVGPADIGLSQVVSELVSKVPGVDIQSGLTPIQQDILWSWRFPRVVLGMMVGGTLAVSGAAYQGAFRNPLADPYLLGVAAGAALGATLAIVSDLPPALVVPAAFVGAVGAVIATFSLGRTLGDRSATTLILAGVAMASFLTALTTFVQQRNSETLREVFAWILGRLSTSGWREVGLLAPYAIVSVAVMLVYRRMLDLLAVGDDEAGSLGVSVARVRAIVVVAATAGTAAAVSVSGLIAFVGIIVPHAVRLFVGTSYRLVLPLSLLSGAAFLVVADLVARSVMAPAELPIGVVTSFFSAPFFMVVLRTSRRSL